MEFKFDPIEEIVEEIRQGHIVIMQNKRLPFPTFRKHGYFCRRMAAGFKILTIKKATRNGAT